MTEIYSTPLPSLRKRVSKCFLELYEDALRLKPGHWFYYQLTEDDKARLQDAATGPLKDRHKRVRRAYLTITHNTANRVKSWGIDATARVTSDIPPRIIIIHNNQQKENAQ